MNETPKPNPFKQLLQRKAEAQKAGRSGGILASRDLLKRFAVGDKPLPKVGRGGRNGSGKP